MNDPQGMTPNYSGVPNGSGVKVNIISLVFNSLAAVLSIVVFLYVLLSASFLRRQRRRKRNGHLDDEFRRKKYDGFIRSNE